MKRLLAIGLVVVVILILLRWLWPSAGTQDAVQFDQVTIDRGDITQIVSAVGSVRALNTVEVGSQLSGQVDRLYADFNSVVEAGELLARIDPQTFERRVQEAEANLAVARANIAIQQAGITKSEANLANARREFERQQALVERGSVSAAALDLAETAYLSARADIDIAQAQLLNAEATVLQREAALEAARIDLDRTEIRSPINGVVIERAVDLGQTVAASLQAPLLFAIAQDLSQIRIEASVDEADIGSVRDGAAARFTVDAFPGREFAGQVAQVRLAPNEAQNVVTYTVVINADNPGRRLLPGMTASIDIITGTRESVLRIDNAAARFRPPDDMVVQAGGAERGRGQGGPGGPGGPGGANPGEQMAETLRELGVGEDRIERIQEDFREAFSQMRGLFMSGADRDVIRQRMEANTRDVLARHLDAAQLEAFSERQREMENTRSATLYSLNPDGSLQPRRVRLGISDDRHTEIVAGDMSSGDSVVSRIRRTAR